MPRIPATTGVILVDHGSKRAAANDQLEDLVLLFKATSGAAIVEPAHMELAPPTIAEAIAACLKQGATEIVVHPYFLAPGRHSKEDIPRMAAEAAAQHGDIPIRVTEPLGLDERLCAVIETRIADAMERNPVA